jgi:hypothetical protein
VFVPVQERQDCKRGPDAESPRISRPGLSALQTAINASLNKLSPLHLSLLIVFLSLYSGCLDLQEGEHLLQNKKDFFHLYHVPPASSLLKTLCSDFYLCQLPLHLLCCIMKTSRLWPYKVPREKLERVKLQGLCSFIVFYLSSL